MLGISNNQKAEFTFEIAQRDYFKKVVFPFAKGTDSNESKIFLMSNLLINHTYLHPQLTQFSAIIMTKH